MIVCGVPAWVVSTSSGGTSFQSMKRFREDEEIENAQSEVGKRLEKVRLAKRFDGRGVCPSLVLAEKRMDK